MIIKVIGTPDANSTSFISDPIAKNYVQNFDHHNPIDLNVLFPGVPEDGLDFLKDLLQLNPHFRMNVD